MPAVELEMVAPAVRVLAVAELGRERARYGKPKDGDSLEAERQLAGVYGRTERERDGADVLSNRAVSCR